MNQSDYALFISVASIFIAIGALFWNVWQKFIFVRPALQVSFGVWGIANSDRRLLMLTVTNMGPGPVVLSACIAKERKPWWKRAKSHPMINPIHGDPADPSPVGIGPFGGGLPAKIDAGEVKQFFFPYIKDCFLEAGLTCVGINDTYHRMIWCRRGDMQTVYESYQRDFTN